MQLPFLNISCIFIRNPNFNVTISHPRIKLFDNANFKFTETVIRLEYLWKKEFEFVISHEICIIIISIIIIFSHRLLMFLFCLFLFIFSMYEIHYSFQITFALTEYIPSFFSMALLLYSKILFSFLLHLN